MGFLLEFWSPHCCVQFCTEATLGTKPGVIKENRNGISSTFFGPQGPLFPEARNMGLAFRWHPRLLPCDWDHPQITAMKEMKKKNLEFIPVWVISLGFNSSIHLNFLLFGVLLCLLSSFVQTLLQSTEETANLLHLTCCCFSTTDKDTEIQRV